MNRRYSRFAYPPHSLPTLPNRVLAALFPQRNSAAPVQRSSGRAAATGCRYRVTRAAQHVTQEKKPIEHRNARLGGGNFSAKATANSLARSSLNCPVRCGRRNPFFRQRKTHHPYFAQPTQSTFALYSFSAEPGFRRPD